MPAPARRIQPLTARLVRVAVPACLLLAACKPVEVQTSARPKYRAPLPEARHTSHPDPDNARWLEAWRDLRDRITPIQEKLGAAQQLHADHHFDGFLELDPNTLGNDDLCSLYHFLERGYFTAEREVLIHLLERRLQRQAAPLIHTDKSRYSERIAAAMQRDELRMVDIESALDLYSKPDTGDFQIPNSLSANEVAELRGAVADMLAATRQDIGALDQRIAELKSDVFGIPYEPPAPVAPAVTNVPEPESDAESPAVQEQPAEAPASMTAPQPDEPNNPDNVEAESPEGDASGFIQYP